MAATRTIQPKPELLGAVPESLVMFNVHVKFGVDPEIGSRVRKLTGMVEDGGGGCGGYRDENIAYPFLNGDAITWET